MARVKTTIWEALHEANVQKREGYSDWRIANLDELATLEVSKDSLPVSYWSANNDKRPCAWYMRWRKKFLRLTAGAGKKIHVVVVLPRPDCDYRGNFHHVRFVRGSLPP